jgi:DNA polymerase-3 subunit delta'
MKGEKLQTGSDQEVGCPHPAETFNLVGHEAQEKALGEALHGRRMHHAWLFTGPKGVGKATLAYRFARALLSAKIGGARPLDCDPEDQIARRIAAGSHPDIFVLRRGVNEKTGRSKRDITADDARALSGFFSLAPSEGGYRVAIVDAVDDLNRHAANALLKTLEEPPARAALLLVCHAPGGALATIRSRCRRLALRPLSDAEMRTALGENASEPMLKLARGRPGRALAFLAQGAGAEELQTSLRAIVSGQARTALGDVHQLLKGETADRLALTLDLAGECARAASVDQSSEAWADAWSNLEELRLEAEDLDMDQRQALIRAAHVLDRAAAAARR